MSTNPIILNQVELTEVFKRLTLVQAGEVVAEYINYMAPAIDCTTDEALSFFTEEVVHHMFDKTKPTVQDKFRNETLATLINRLTTTQVEAKQD